MVRIQKIIADAGISSRRAAERLLLQGRIMVNGQIINELGTKVDPSQDHIRVDGKLIPQSQPKVYMILHKPQGCVSTMHDPEGRKTIKDFFRTSSLRIYPVGRLDFNTEGLIVLTNDGDFAAQLLHPRYHIPKTYVAKVSGVLSDQNIAQLQKGVMLDDGMTAPCRINKIKKLPTSSWLEITLFEGRKRQIRRMMESVGCSVIRLKRIGFGSLRLGTLPPGQTRPLEPEELAQIRTVLTRSSKRSRPGTH
ncbi:MAG: pseudouridine synthase [Nitrospiraceae bacterium]|nr:pseudouridine synthase [Nitrospiraceae bacterium]